MWFVIVYDNEFKKRTYLKDYTVESEAGLDMDKQMHVHADDNADITVVEAKDLETLKRMYRRYFND